MCGKVYVADTLNNRIQRFRRVFGTRGVNASPSGEPVVEWDSAFGRSYTVWLSADLGEWLAFPEIAAGSKTGVSSWTDDGRHSLGVASGSKRRFYRIELLP